MTEAEFLQRLEALHEQYDPDARPDADPRQLAVALEDAEVNLKIDYALGAEFPARRREELLHAHRAVAARRDQLIDRLMAHGIAPEDYAVELQRLSTEQMAAYARVLAPDEFRAFVGADPDDTSHIPLNPTYIQP